MPPTSSEYWEDRGYPWEYDRGPPKNRRWLRLFAETPNYRALGKAVMGSEKFRWHFGPMFYRGRLRDNRVKVLLIGQEGAQDESLSHRSFTGGTGARMQHFLNHIGITESYLFLNTFVYPIYGQYSGSTLRKLAQDPASPIVQHRHEIFNYVLERNDVQLVVAVGTAAKESIVSWIESRGGSCPSGASDVSRCTGANLDPFTKIVGVIHPGAAAGGAVTAIIEDFREALSKIKDWMEDDPDWLPPDPAGERHTDELYQYKSAPIPFRDFCYGFPLRLGRGGTSSNRKDNQRSIQIFSAGGKYNAQGASLDYPYEAEGSDTGYSQEEGDLPYEPPRKYYRDFDSGPGSRFARLLMGGRSGLEWPDFNSLGANCHLSFGYGPIYRGRPNKANVLIVADQQSRDDLFTGRALTGESGQKMQEFLRAMGIVKRYVIIRVLPVETLDLHWATVREIVEDPQVQKVYQAIFDEIRARNSGLKLVLTFGYHARALLDDLDIGGLDKVELKAWRQSGALADWQAKLNVIQGLSYTKEISNPTFTYDGERGQIPRFDLPFGTLRWVGTSGNRASQPIDRDTGELSYDYFKLYMPEWAHELSPEPLSASEQDAVDAIS